MIIVETKFYGYVVNITVLLTIVRYGILKHML
jgi:hypothetical protein